MSSKIYVQLQTDLKQVGLYPGTVDGKWGPNSINGFAEARRMANKESLPPFLKGYAKSVAWSGKVSDKFLETAKQVSNRLGIPDPDLLMACMAFETGRTFSPTVQNGAGAPYYGIIQFGKDAATDAGTTIPALLKMSAVEQLEYVYNFFKPYTGKLKTLSDVYCRILWPKAVGKPENYVLWDKETRPTTYRQNSGLDINKDGMITKAEAAAMVNKLLIEGVNPINLKPV